MHLRGHFKHADLGASMGPHLGRCGNPRYAGSGDGRWRLQWDRTSEGAEILMIIRLKQKTGLCFNGTAPRKVRKSLYVGRVVTVQLASMGPHLGRCGNDAIAAAVCVFCAGFNGTAPRKVRKYIQDSLCLMGYSASMGPHLGRCGNAGTKLSSESPDSCFNGTAPRKVRK